MSNFHHKNQLSGRLNTVQGAQKSVSKKIPPVQNKVQLTGQLNSVRDAQKRISNKIRAIQNQLKMLEKVPQSQPWVSFGRVNRIEFLKSSFPDLRTALSHDLMVLKNYLRSLRVSEKQLRTAATQRQAMQYSRDFKGRLEKTLKDAEKSGQLDEGELRNLLNESERVLEGFVNLLEANPSEKNMGLVLSEMEIPFLLGSDSETRTCGRAWRSLGKAAKTIYNRDEQLFRKKPDIKNFSKLLNAKARNQTFGVEFDEKPKNWKGASPGTVHNVIKGDSLSAISKKYYGDPGFWDIIYLENLSVIGDNPDALRVGIKLNIP